MVDGAAGKVEFEVPPLGALHAQIAASAAKAKIFFTVPFMIVNL
jgi:hypothetical protein